MTKTPGRLSIAVAVGALAVLIGAGVASATSWGWTGNIGIGLGNGQCPLYSGQSACSPYSTSWYSNSASNKGPTGQEGTILAGFENSSTIRGAYLSPFQSQTIYESSYFSAGANLRGTATFCTWYTWCAGSGDQNYPADTWFQVNT